MDSEDEPDDDGDELDDSDDEDWSEEDEDEDERASVLCSAHRARCLDVTPLTVQRYKARIRNGNNAAKAHGNTLNKHAANVDLVWLVKLFEEFAGEVGEVVPVRGGWQGDQVLQS
ncbi:unnamed protein product [Phytophthora lilii]|uniref:Unnamed protein product n=1 Tax=Phytophthora lilii TaxID=2077276 RepID=A0A9W6TSR8_9STRA|nr:unnamed protein product [Phytophthora lilii]